MSNLLSIALANLLVKGHADAALLQFNELQRVDYESKQAGTSIEFEEYMQRAIPAATSLALTLELALKTLYYQHFGKYPKTHDLEAMVAELPQKTRDVLEDTYRDMYLRNVQLQVAHFAVFVSESGEEHSQTPIPDLSSFDAGLAHASAAYVKWRYLYEHMESPNDTQIHFKALLSLIESARTAINAHQGNVKIQAGDSTI